MGSPTVLYFVLFVASTTSQGIKNSPSEHHHQYHGYQQPITRGTIQPQQQQHVFGDVQQHRFQLGGHIQQQQQPLGAYAFQPTQQIPDLTYQANHQGFTPISAPTDPSQVDLTVQSVQRPSQSPRQPYPTFSQDYSPILTPPQPIQQPVHAYVQPLQINSQFTGFNPHVIQQAPPSPTSYQPTYHPQASREPPTRVPTRVPEQVREHPTRADPTIRTQPTRTSPTRVTDYNNVQFEPNYVQADTRKKQPHLAHHHSQQSQHGQYLTEVTSSNTNNYNTNNNNYNSNNYNANNYNPNNNNNYKEQKPQYSQPLNTYQTTPSYIIETQPPTTRKQKPLEAITFSSEENQGAVTPKVVKYRIRPTKKPAEETTKKRGEKHYPELYNKSERQKLYQQALAASGGTTTTTTTARIPSRRATVQSTTPNSQLQKLDLQEELQKQIQAQLADKENPFGTLKVTLPDSLTPEQIANLPQLALGDAFAQFAPAAPSISGSDPSTLFLDRPPTVPSEHHQVRGRKKPLTSRQPLPPPPQPEVNLEELTKGLPPGFELIRQTQDGALEPVNSQNLPQKKVTFVILEEQPDGSVKVQGVRGNEDNGEADIDSILQKIQQGEIKLPPSTRGATPQESVAAPSYVKHNSKVNYVHKYTDEPYYRPPSTTTSTTTTTTTTPAPTTTRVSPSTSRGAYVIRRRRPGTTYRTTTSTTTPRTGYSANSHSGPPFPVSVESNNYDYSASSPSGYSPTVEYTTKPVHFVPTLNSAPELPQEYQFNYQQTEEPKTYQYEQSYQESVQYPPQPQPYPEVSGQTQASERQSATETLLETLRSKGLYAMAKFLHQSGLDSVLNDTGPYTIFVPTDKAFRTLLVQLGGPDRADQKFKENPRLLSGLLLHHVIPGAFSIGTLQDEMTGVSLAGTQLRVNTYTTQDNQWNDLKVVTINGAKIVEDKADITVPQGIAHVVDRVMFPLPVGDIIQTLQADREQRFTRFIKLLQETGVAEMLTGTKTYTIFAPTDEALSEEELKRLLESKSEARSLAMRHITPGSLYSAGMHYYQLRDTMISNKQISLFKEAGRVKANNSQVVTRNIPATNGVIHAVDSLL